MLISSDMHSRIVSLIFVQVNLYALILFIISSLNITPRIKVESVLSSRINMYKIKINPSQFLNYII